MIERRTMGRIRRTIELPARQAELLRLLAEKHGLTETGVICTAITQLAERDGVKEER